MLDVVIRGGLVVDGTGVQGEVGDVGIRSGRIACVGRVDEEADRVIDADGLIVAPGFVDIHTHVDAQVFWDPSLSPSSLQGVTTVIGGNCGFSVAPLSGEHDDGDYLMRMLARVEGMPLEALQSGVPWDWRTTEDYLNRLDGKLSLNTCFLVGHSALRRLVMHDDAVGRAATADEIDSMAAQLEVSLAAGGMGFSSSGSPTHSDHNGDPVPSRFATDDELVHLATVTGRYDGTVLEYAPGSGLGEGMLARMTAMSVAANRSVNWNVVQVYADNRDLVQMQLASFDYADVRGGRIVPLTLPDSLRVRMNLRSGVGLDTLPGWAKVMALGDDQKLAFLSDPIRRAELGELAASAEGAARQKVDWASYVLVESAGKKGKRWTGSTIGAVADALGTDPWNALIDIVVDDRLNTVISKPDNGQDDISWQARVDCWRDPRVLVGASDAGAHLDMLDSFAYPTTLLSRAVRERALLPVEEAVQMLTDRPARFYGLRDRGVLLPGSWADVVVFDLGTVGPGEIHTRYDLPAGAGRLYGEANGVEVVLVNGVPVVENGQFVPARPGRVLRSGRDTVTVPVGRTGSNGR